MFTQDRQKYINMEGILVIGFDKEHPWYWSPFVYPCNLIGPFSHPFVHPCNLIGPFSHPFAHLCNLNGTFLTHLFILAISLAPCHTFVHHAISLAPFLNPLFPLVQSYWPLFTPLVTIVISLASSLTLCSPCNLIGLFSQPFVIPFTIKLIVVNSFIKIVLLEVLMS